MGDVAIVLVCVVLAFFLFCLIYSSFHTNEKVALSKEELIKEIEDYIQDPSSSWPFGDFLAIPVQDPFLDKIRERCSNLPTEFPSKDRFCNDQGVEVLKSIVKELRGLEK